MAKTLAILASLLFLIISVICVPAKERVPSLEIIQREDAEEGIGFPVEGLWRRFFYIYFKFLVGVRNF